MRRAWPLGIALALLLAIVASWRWTRADGQPQTSELRSLVVQRQPFTATLAFAGRIAPGEAVSITAPFDGAVRRVGFSYGGRVAAGDTLLVLDTDEIAAARNQAEAAWLKARQPAEAATNWGRGPEVAAARRRAQLARLDLARLEREARESRRLLAKGLIPRNEHEGIEQQLTTQRMAAAAAEDELAETIGRGGPDAVRIARLELENARAGLARSEQALGAAEIRAPVSGTLVAPSTGNSRSGGGDALHPGTRLTRGQLIGVIARDGGLSVTFEVDEADVNALAPGQTVIVTGPGFAGVTLSGELAAIAAPSEASGTAAIRFTATARLAPLAADAASRVRIGMTAAVVVLTYQAPAAIVVPPEAVLGAAPSAVVRVRAGGRIADRRVTIGRVTPAGVEIRAGLSPGETVVWAPAAAQTPAAGAP